jgi:hypothetical protein
MSREPFEGRSKGRTTINHEAKVLVEENTGIFACRVSNVTTDGACIELIGLETVPPAFELSSIIFAQHVDADWVGGSEISLALPSKADVFVLKLTRPVPCLAIQSFCRKIGGIRYEASPLLKAAYRHTAELRIWESQMTQHSLSCVLARLDLGRDH